MLKQCVEVRNKPDLYMGKLGDTNGGDGITHIDGNGRIKPGCSCKCWRGALMARDGGAGVHSDIIVLLEEHLGGWLGRSRSQAGGEDSEGTHGCLGVDEEM